jgi:glycosyltransferase involved in cell wall biosynthesis
MKILHVNQQGGRGGAAGICMSLHRALLAAGHESAVQVGRQAGEQPGVSLLEHDRYRSAWGRCWMALARWVNQYSGRIRGADRVSTRWLPRLASPRRFWSWWAGHEDFDFPGTAHLLEQAPFVPDVLHLHNLHGDFFDLRELSRLSRAVPTVITLHDAWLLAGHCSHSFDCERWKTGCGFCSGLHITPAIRRDSSAYNWKRKGEIYQDSHLSLVCPSEWLADKVSQSILMSSAERLKVINNGVDTNVFKPGDRAAARERLDWPRDAFIVMFAANGVRQSIWKDYPTMREAIRLAGEKASGRPVRFFAVGDTALAEQAGSVKIEFLPHRDSMVECYQAADVYLHAARADTFPTTILEALACGMPVVATAVGGISEQIIEGQTGFLVPAGDARAMAEKLILLIISPDLVRSMGTAAARDATERFSLERMISSYVQLYKILLEQKVETHGN